MMAAAGTGEGARSIWTWLCAVLANGTELDLQGVIEKLKARWPTSETERRAYEAVITPLMWGLEAKGFALGNLAESQTAMMRDGTVDEVLANSLELVDVARQESFPGVLQLPNPRVEVLRDFLADPRWVEDEQTLGEFEALVERYREKRAIARDPAD